MKAEKKYTQQQLNEAINAERDRCANIVLDIGFSHTAGLNQFIASEFARAESLIRMENE